MRFLVGRTGKRMRVTMFFKHPYSINSNHLRGYGSFCLSREGRRKLFNKSGAGNSYGDGNRAKAPRFDEGKRMTRDPILSPFWPHNTHTA